MGVRTTCRLLSKGSTKRFSLLTSELTLGQFRFLWAVPVGSSSKVGQRSKNALLLPPALQFVALTALPESGDARRESQDSPIVGVAALRLVRDIVVRVQTSFRC